MNTTQSEKLYAQALDFMPGGVNSPVRACRSVGRTPLFIDRAEGSKIYDVDGNEFIDYICSWGPNILGHKQPDVIKAVTSACQNGLTFGACHSGEIELAELIRKNMPSIEMLRLVNSGTEAVMSAIRAARGFTKRDKIVKFEGCYHGHSDGLLVKGGSGLLTNSIPNSAGVPKGYTDTTLLAKYNDEESVQQLFDNCGDEIACVILEPIAGNMNMVQPSAEFVQALRGLTEQHGAVLIYDEVMTGFRVALGCAQSLHGIKPDLTTMGKVIGGGMPLAAFGGRKDIMACISPLGGVYQAGTLSGNPLAVTAGLKTLEIIQRPGFYETLNHNCERLLSGLNAAAKAAGVSFSSQYVGGMFGFYFNDKIPQSFADVSDSDKEAFKLFFHGMLERGVSLAPSAFEASFMSAAHTDELIDQTIAHAQHCFGA